MFEKVDWSWLANRYADELERDGVGRVEAYKRSAAMNDRQLLEALLEAVRERAWKDGQNSVYECHPLFQDY